MKESGKYYEIEVDQLTLNVLNGFAKYLAPKLSVNIGVLENNKGPSARRSDYGQAQIAAVHEFGGHPIVTNKMRAWFWYNLGVRLARYTKTIRIPMRSFLRLTMNKKADAFQQYLDGKAPAIFNDIVTGKWTSTLNSMGAQWVAYVREAFDTQGWGSWKPIKSLTMFRRSHNRGVADDWGAKTVVSKSSQPLVHSGSLRNSIRHEVVSK